MVERACRVCGLRFTARRVDAITCTSTCRQRLRRGQAFAYLDSLSEAGRVADSEWHAAIDQLIAAVKEHNTIRRDNRAKKRARKQEHQRKRLLNDFYADVGRRQVQQQEQEWQHWLKVVVTGAIILLTRARHNDMSAQAIFEKVVEASRRSDLTLEQVAAVLDGLHASGDYDRIIADALRDA